VKRKVIAIITDILGDRVVVGEKELEHAIDDHFSAIPQDIMLELPTGKQIRSKHKKLKKVKL